LVHTNHGRGPILNILLFLLRRIILALNFYFLSNQPQAQVFILMLTSFIILLYQCLFKPFVTRKDTFFEFYNEATLLFIGYCLNASLQFDTIQSQIDISILTLILCAILLNFINFLYSAQQDLKLTCNRIGFKIRKFWNDLTKPKPCCCQAHNNNHAG
jgi:hypothetical protein